MLDEWIRGEGDNEKNGGGWLNGKKGRLILVIVICLGLLALIWPNNKADAPRNQIAQPLTDKVSQGMKASMQADLEAILSQIKGAGVVEVSVTLGSQGTRSYATNNREERRETSENGRSQTVEESSTRDLAVSSGNPLLVEEKMPEIMGVLVVADGAGDPQVQESLTNATSTLLNIPAHKVRVLPREGGNDGH